MTDILKTIWQDPSARKIVVVGVIGLATWIFDQLLAATGKGQFKPFVNTIAMLACLYIALDVIAKVLVTFADVLGLGN